MDNNSLACFNDGGADSPGQPGQSPEPRDFPGFSFVYIIKKRIFVTKQYLYSVRGNRG